MTEDVIPGGTRSDLFANFPAGSPGEGSRANDSCGGGEGPQWSHCVSVCFRFPSHDLILFFKLHFRVLRTQRKKNVLTQVFMCVNMYITRTNVISLTTLGHVQIVYITAANDHISIPEESVMCVGKPSVYYCWGHRMCISPLQLIKHQHWYWCGVVLPLWS